jgi:threonine aldolase
MANQLGVRAWVGQGDEVYLHRDSHLMVHEAGGVAALWGAQPRALGGERGRVDLEELETFVLPSAGEDPHHPIPRLVCAENTHMAAGGAVYPPADLAALGALARRLGLRLHLDGARLANAAVAGGTTLAEACAPADTVQVCLSKGLGAPVGSVLCGPADAVARGRRARKLLGGGWRQAGIVAAAALWALENNVGRLADDHRRARRLAEAIADCRRTATDPATVETNIVLARVRSRAEDAETVAAELTAAGVLCGAIDRRTVRFVTHLDVDDEALERAAATARAVLDRLVD